MKLLAQRRLSFFVLFVVFLTVTGYCGFWRPDPADTPGFRRTSAARPKLEMLSADFDEPFVPLVAGADSLVLSRALESYRADPREKSLKVDILEEYLKKNPKDPWAPSVRGNLGLYYHRAGRFTRALEHLKTAWEELSSRQEPVLKAFADRILGEYARTLSHLGRIEELKPLLESVESRSFRGPSTEAMAAAREGLLIMETKPEIAFLCGPSALRRVGEKGPGWNQESRKIVESLPSTQKGTSLLQVRDLSRRLGMNFQMAYRESGSAFVTPAVTHWKAGHFAALQEQENGLYPVGDDTAGFGREEILMSADSIEQEASGYFLVPSGPLPSGWRVVDEQEGNTVWGRGYTGDGSDGGGSGDGDPTGPPPPSCGWGGGGGDGNGGDSGGGPGTGAGPSFEGMTSWSVHLMLVSLKLQDTPVGWSPAAFAVPFTVTYIQRDSGLPAIFDFSNLGPKWTTNWTSFITDHRSTDGRVTLYKPNGGYDDYSFYGANTTSSRGAYSDAVLTDTGAGYRLAWPDGSVDEYLQLVGSRYHLTARITPQGNSTSLQYDTLGRLEKIVDAAGREMLLSYEHPTDSLKITKVTDPFGRFASFTYTADGHLESVTDVLGLTSSYQYGANDFINTLTTPYGTTTFEYADALTDPALGVSRNLTVTDVAGRRYRVERNQRVGLPFSETLVPA